MKSLKITSVILSIGLMSMLTSQVSLAQEAGDTAVPAGEVTSEIATESVAADVPTEYVEGENLVTDNSSEVAVEDRAVVNSDAYSQTQAQMMEMQLRYGSLSSAMVGYYAGGANQKLSSFLNGSPGTFGNFTGLSQEEFSNMAMSLGKNATVADLDSLLQQSDLTLSSQAYQDVNAAANELDAKSKTFDALVVKAGANWAQSVMSLRAPQLVTPSVPQVKDDRSVQLPAEGLAFGMFVNRSLNALVRQWPNVMGDVVASGVGSVEAQKAWKQSMQAAMTASKPDFESMLPSDCGAAFIQGLSGNVTSNACSPCVSAGRLASSQLDLLFSPGSGSVIPNAADPALNPTEWASLTPFQKEQILQQNPSIADAVAASTSASSSEVGCAGLGSNVQGNVTSSLPSVLDYLTN